MNEHDLNWAIDVAMVLRRRKLEYSGSEQSHTIVSLIDSLLRNPRPTNWDQVFEHWNGKKMTHMERNESRSRRIRRTCEMLLRASSGLNVENIGGSAQFRARTRIANALTTAQLLLNASHYQSARKTYEYAFKISTNGEITDCAIRSLIMIRKIDAVSGSRDSLTKIDRAIARLRKVLDVEIEAESLQDHARALLVKYTSKRQATLQQYRRIILRLRILSKRTDSTAVVALAYYRSVLWLASIQNESDRILKIGAEAIQFLNDNPQAESAVYRVEFEGSRLSAMIAKRDYHGAESVWNDIRSKLTEGAANWCSLLQIYFLVCMITGNYDAARDALWEYESKRKKGEPEWRKNLWAIYRAYILFLIDQQVIEPGQYVKASRVYMTSLEKQTQKSKHGKAIAGSAVYILRILQWLKARRYSDVIAEVERMRQYAHRHLNGQQTIRTSAFIRMLATIPTADFNPTDSAVRGATVWDRYCGGKMDVRDSAEIIPYEFLWELTVKILDSSDSKRRR